MLVTPVKASASSGLKFEAFNSNKIQGEAEKERELTDFEKDCLTRFDKNDQEIEEMLDLVIAQIDRILLHAKDIDADIHLQSKMIKKVNNAADKARDSLRKKNSDLSDLLGKYRAGAKLWKDIVLILILVGLVAANIKVMQWKGWIPNR